MEEDEAEEREIKETRAEEIDEKAKAELLKKIVEEFLSEEFTAEDVRESISDVLEEFDKRYLDMLVREGALDFNEETNKYTVNSDAPLVTDLLEGNSNDLEEVA